MEDYPNVNPYVYTLQNPINLVDPDGKAPMWKPDRNGNLRAEKGDNVKTLAKYLNRSEADIAKNFKKGGQSIGSNYQFKTSEKVNLNNNYKRALTKSNSEKGLTTQEILKENLGMGDSYERSNKKTDSYNCTDGVICGTKGVEITPANADIYGTDDLSWNGMLRDKSQYIKVNQNEAKFGQTIYSFNNEQGTHAAVYYGTSQDGTIFVFTKNGEYAKPAIMTLKSVEEIYGPTSAIYNPVIKK